VAAAANQSAQTSQDMARGSEHLACVATEAAAMMERFQPAIARVISGNRRQEQAVQEAD